MLQHLTRSFSFAFLLLSAACAGDASPAAAPTFARNSCDACPAADSCDADVPFCEALSDLLKTNEVPNDKELRDACAANQPHCDLCSHVRASCLQGGEDAAKCAELEAECNCAALVDGLPSGCPAAGDGGACEAPEDCAADLVCVDYQDGMCLRRCDPAIPNVCGDGSWCTISSGPEPGLKCTPPAPMP